jgi:signal transduction histidine kinase
LDLARGTGSANLTGQCLIYLAETLRRLGQWDAAQQIVDEAGGLLRSIVGSRNYLLLLEIAGKLALAQGKTETAAALFQQVCHGGEQLKQIDIQIMGDIGLAQGRALQGQDQEAVQLLQQALELSVQHHRVIDEIEILQVLVDLHTKHGLPLSARESKLDSELDYELDSEPSAALHYLHKALRLALSIEGYVVKPTLYQALAHEYAQLRDFKTACEFALMAESARDKLHHQQVLSRAHAMQIQFQTERVRAQALHHRKLAEAETRRAELIEESNRNLALMNEQEIRIEQEARKKAERATRSKAAYLANMSHEIRTPVNAILGIAHLAMQTDLLPKQHDYLNKIHRSGASLLEIINDILDLSKIEAGQLALESVPFNLDEVLEEVARSTRAEANAKQISYLFDVPRAVPRHVRGDPLRLGQILRNLVLNALRNTARGQIRLSCSVQQSDSQQVCLRFSVEDTGVGMDAEEAADLFSPLARSVRARRAGRIPLGLWVSFHLVRLMGAAFTVQSEPGHGSCFSFDVVLGRSPQVPADDLVWPGARLLLITTDAREQRDLCDALHGLPLRIDCVDDAAQALIAMRLATDDPYHLLLINQHWNGSDGSMGGDMDGNVLAHRLQSEPGAPPMLMLIESDLKVDPELCQSDVAAQVFKPIVLRKFLQQVYAVLVPSSDLPTVVNTGRLHDARVLLVDDNEFNQEIGAELLAMQGIEVDIAKDGQQALDMLHIVGSDFYQLILMDLEMPILDGHEATRILRQDERFNHVPIVAMTAHTNVEMRDRCLLNGMQDYIEKPINPVLLNQMLARYLH